MHQKQHICILVKAYPQPSQKYEETVCCAGVTEDGRFPSACIPSLIES